MPEPRHVAVLAWDPTKAPDPGMIRTVMESQFGCRVVLYPTPDGNHSALGSLLTEFTDERCPPVTIVTEPTQPRAAQPVMRWVHGGDRVPYFTSRAEELARLTRWARDPEVRLIGVTAWGGAGKTALVTEWLAGLDGARHRPGVRGVFAWSFYERNSAQKWGSELLDWVHRSFGVVPSSGPLAWRIVAALREVPLVLLLDGLEVGQEGPAGDQFGRLSDGTLRVVLTALCQVEHAGLVLLTSRFPFADLAQFDGGAVRMTELPPFTPNEGATVLARAGGGWLAEADRLDLVQAVDGHALAVGALAGALAERPPAADLAALRAELLEIGRTDSRVGKVLQFYGDRLTEADRALVAIVGLFQRPVPVATVLALGDQEPLGARLSGWTSVRVQEAVRQRLSGLLSWHPDSTLSAHPLIRDAFRPLVLTSDAAQLATDMVLSDLPAGTVTTRDDALRVIEMIELLVDAHQWEAADLLRADRLGGDVWRHIPAARLGQRCAAAFVGTPSHQDTCRERLGAGILNYHVAVFGLLGPTLAIRVP
ncbi:MAG: SIR2 family protein, partial [Actinomycetes bacterium]